MKKGINKFAKGVFAIFTIKLLFFGIVFLNQACQTDDNIFSISEKELALEKFENILKQTIPVVKTNIKEKNLNSSFRKGENDYESKKMINPLIDGTKELLLAFDVEENDLIEIFGSKNDPRLVIVGLALLNIRYNDNSQTAINFSNLFVESAYAQSGIGGCVLEALGVNAAVNALKGGIKKLGKKGALKLLRKVGGKALGPIGVALAIVDFADCMGAF
jgi:hypothetical protein